jgi:CheY-like chemotaxis protein
LFRSSRGQPLRLGYGVFEAENGERALKILDWHSINLLLTDVIMTAVSQRMRRTAGIPICS